MECFPPDQTIAYAAFVNIIGIGGDLAILPLPHHRAYGTVHGDSEQFPVILRGVAGVNLEIALVAEGFRNRLPKCPDETLTDLTRYLTQNIGAGRS